MQVRMKLASKVLRPPVSIETAKHWCRIPLDDDAEDAQVQRLIHAACEFAEHRAKRWMYVQEWDLMLPSLPSDTHLEFYVAPVLSVTHFKYHDGTQLVTWDAANYELLVHETECIVRPISAWPAVRGQEDDVQIRLKGGYEKESDVPSGLLLWMQLFVSTYYNGRELSEDRFSNGLLDPYTVRVAV